MKMKTKKVIKEGLMFAWVLIDIYVKVGIVLMITWIVLNDFTHIIEENPIWIPLWAIIGLFWIIYPIFKNENKN